MKPAYLKIVIAEGHDQKIAEFKKSFPKSDDVAITYYHNGRVNEKNMTMNRFFDLLEGREIAEAIHDAKAMCHPMHPGMTERDRMDVEAYQLALKNLEDILDAKN